MRQTEQSPRGFLPPDMPNTDIAQQCVRCGICLPHCPTYLETMRETSSPRGRIVLINAVAEGKLDILSPGFVEQMNQCLDCRACEDVCPSGVKYGQLVENARAQIMRAKQAHAKKIDRTRDAVIYDGLFGDLRRFRAAVGLLRIYQRSGGQVLARSTRLLRAIGLDDAEQMLPNIPHHFFLPNNQSQCGSADLPDVAIFAGCVMSTLFAQTDFATVRLLSACGFGITVPADQGCCGAIDIHSGYADRARDLAKKNIATFEAAGAEYIAVNAAGCGASLKEYPNLFEDDPHWRKRAEAFSSRIRDITELLAEFPIPAQKIPFHPLPITVAYQDACHLAHAQRITQQPRDLLRAIPQLQVREMEEASLCCGSAGIYNLQQPEMAGKLQQRKIEHTIETGAKIVVTANPGCYLQLRNGLRKQHSKMGVIHIVDLLDASIRGLSVEEVLTIANCS